MKAEEGFLLLLKGLSWKLLTFYFKGSAEEYRESGGKCSPHIGSGEKQYFIHHSYL